MKSSLGRALFYFELAVCFGPLTVLWLFGVLLFPIWLVGIVGYFTGLIPFGEPEGILPWRVLWPMVMVASGAIGLFGLARAIWLVEQPSPHPEWAKTTLLAVLVGLGGLAFFNLYDPSISFYEGLLLLVLPCVGTGALWMLLPAVIPHVYPVLLQRSILLRLQPLLDDSSQRTPKRTVIDKVPRHERQRAAAQLRR